MFLPSILSQVADAKELAKLYGDERQRTPNVLKNTFTRANQIDHRGTDENIEKLRNDMKQQLLANHISHIVAGSLWKIWQKLKDCLFVFVKNPDVDGTTNRAERALRAPVAARKISSGSRSDGGARIYEILMSVWHILTLRGQDLITHGSSIIQTSHG